MSRYEVREERLSLVLVTINLRCQPNTKVKVSGGERGIIIVRVSFFQTEI